MAASKSNTAVCPALLLGVTIVSVTWCGPVTFQVAFHPGNVAESCANVMERPPQLHIVPIRAFARGSTVGVGAAFPGAVFPGAVFPKKSSKLSARRPDSANIASAAHMSRDFPNGSLFMGSRDWAGSFFRIGFMVQANSGGFGKRAYRAGIIAARPDKGRERGEGQGDHCRLQIP